LKSLTPSPKADGDDGAFHVRRRSGLPIIDVQSRRNCGRRILGEAPSEVFAAAIFVEEKSASDMKEQRFEGRVFGGGPKFADWSTGGNEGFQLFLA
jgi:hypothetical protein